jgi:hypothetical protein
MAKRNSISRLTGEAAIQKRGRYAVPDKLDEKQVANIVRLTLSGGKDSSRSQRVVWEDAGDEALVHLDSVVVRLLPRTILVSAEFETDQTGVGALIVTFALGSTQDKTGLFAMSEDRVRGHPLLASRWGAIFRETVWAALLASARTHATERGKMPSALHPMKGKLNFVAAAPIPVAAEAVAAMRVVRARSSTKS